MVVVSAPQAGKGAHASLSMLTQRNPGEKGRKAETEEDEEALHIMAEAVADCSPSLDGSAYSPSDLKVVDSVGNEVDRVSVAVAQQSSQGGRQCWT
jgi:hypothetical protein